MGPLSAKQHREYLKFSAQEARASDKMEREEARKQQLHEIKLVEAAGKAGQTLGHKEDIHKYKMGTLGAPLKIKTPNPLAGAEIFKRGQHMLPYQVEDAAKARKAAKENTDTVPAMLTPGEAVIPQPAAQNPKNKPIIKRMVQEGRKANRRGYADGTLDVNIDTDGIENVARELAQQYLRDGSVNIVNSDVIPSRVQQAAGYMDGSSKVSVNASGSKQKSKDRDSSNESSNYFGRIGYNSSPLSVGISGGGYKYSGSNSENSFKGGKSGITGLDATYNVDKNTSYAIELKRALDQNDAQKEQANKQVEFKYRKEFNDGTSAVPQLMNYNEGTIQVPVPSLAYEHSDVPGSSFKDGTEEVPNFSRGSSASYHYQGGTEDVPKLSNEEYRQQFLEQEELSRRLANENKSPEAISAAIPKNVVVESTKLSDSIESAVPRSAYPTDVTESMKLKDVQAKINGSVSSEFDIPERPFKNLGMPEDLPMFVKPQVVVPVNNNFPALHSTGEQTTDSTYFVNKRIPKPQLKGEGPSTYFPEDISVVPEVKEPAQASDAEMEAILVANEKVVPPLKPEDDETRPEYWIKHLRGSQKDVDKAMANKDDESAIKSLSDLFTYKGIKSILGLNDQEVARLAVATVAGRAMGYDTARALSYGGRQAFETSLRRQAQEEANKRQDKQLAAQAEREDMRTAITLAGQAKTEKRAAAKEKLDEKKLELQNRIQNAKEERDRQYRIFQDLKEDNKWTHQQSKDARAEQQHLQDKLQTYLAMDVNPAVRSKALDLIAKSKTPEDWLNNMRNATTYLAANVQHYPPGYGRKGGSGSGDDDGEGGGKTKYAKEPKMMFVNGQLMPVQYHKGNYQTMDGRPIPPNAVKTIEAHRYEEDTVANKVEALVPQGAKDKDGKPFNVKGLANNSNRILSGIPGGLTIDNKADVMNLVIPQLVESGVQDPSTVRQVIRGNLAKTTSQSDKDLWKPKGKSLSAKSMTEFTGALDTVINNAASKSQVIDDQTAYEALKRNYNAIPADVRTKMEKSNLTQEGYSTFQDWAIATTTGNPKWKSYTEPKPK